MPQHSGSPVDNATYNLLQTLVSKLEAIEVYGKYERDGDGEIFRELAEDDRRHAERLVAALRGRLGSGGMGSGAGGGMGGGRDMDDRGMGGREGSSR